MRALFARSLCLLLLLPACSDRSGVSAGAPAPGFEIERLDGARVALADLRGKTVLLDFWATWCPPCILEIPELNALYEAHQGNGFEILAISLDDDSRVELTQWVRENDIHYPVARGNMDLAHEYGALQFPYHILVGPEGEILERLPPGFHDRKEFEALLSRHR
jgi:peroxiredoxin